MLMDKAAKRDQVEEMNAAYRSLMATQAQRPAQKYAAKRREIEGNLKRKDYWPKSMKHPDKYRGFYWTEDMAFCGFATTEHQDKTVGMIKQALSRSKGGSRSPQRSNMLSQGRKTHS